MGEEPLSATPEQTQTIRAFELLKNGMGGIDWAGLPYVVAHLGVQDVPGLIEALHTIKTYQPPSEAET